jgi:hypothetical protein
MRNDGIVLLAVQNLYARVQMKDRFLILMF